MLTKIETTTQREPIGIRVALHPFLAGMNSTQLALLAECAIPVHSKKGQTILRQGELANRFYLIESGKVVLESGEGFGDAKIVEMIGPGDLLGWSWMFPPYVWHFTARAVEPTRAIFFYGTILREVLRARPLTWLRTPKTDEPRDGKTLAGCAPKNAVALHSRCDS